MDKRDQTPPLPSNYISLPNNGVYHHHHNGEIGVLSDENRIMTPVICRNELVKSEDENKSPVYHISDHSRVIQHYPISQMDERSSPTCSSGANHSGNQQIYFPPIQTKFAMDEKYHNSHYRYHHPYHPLITSTSAIQSNENLTTLTYPHAAYLPNHHHHHHHHLENSISAIKLSPSATSSSTIVTSHLPPSKNEIMSQEMVAISCSEAAASSNNVCDSLKLNCKLDNNNVNVPTTSMYDNSSTEAASNKISSSSTDHPESMNNNPSVKTKSGGRKPEKPAMSYINMIVMAIKDSPQKRRTLSEIYKYLQSK